MLSFIYYAYFKEYFSVNKIFVTLKKFLSTRDALILKLIPEVKDKKEAQIVVSLIEERKLNFSSSFNNAIKADVKLNSELRKFYKKLSEQKLNEVEIQVFSKIMGIEKDLKALRNKYTLAVEEYNKILVKHKFVCLKIIKMKPLDTYKVSN